MDQQPPDYEYGEASMPDEGGGMMPEEEGPEEGEGSQRKRGREDDEEAVEEWPGGNEDEDAGEEGHQAELDAKDARCEALERELAEAQGALGQWRRAFSGAGGGGTPGAAEGGAEIHEPAAALEQMLALHTAQHTLREQVKEERRRGDMLLHQLAIKDHELHQLKVHMHELKEAARPSSVQVQQLLLDPAVNREFSRMKEELEASGKKLQEVQGELEAARFTQESKAGRMLIAKCRTLQAENEEIFSEMSEGKVKRLEHEVALLKDYIAELQRSCSEWHSTGLAQEDELDGHQQAIFALQRQMRAPGSAGGEVHRAH